MMAKMQEQKAGGAPSAGPSAPKAPNMGLPGTKYLYILKVLKQKKTLYFRGKVWSQQYSLCPRFAPRSE